MRRSVTFILSAALMCLAAGCSKPVEQDPQVTKQVDRSSDAVLTNPEELGLVIRVPFESDEIDDIAWKRIAEEKKVIAVIRLTPEGIKRADLEIFKGGKIGRGAAEIRSWYPKELLTQSEMGNDEPLAGDLFPIDAFALAPFVRGTVIRVDGTDYYVIEMTE